MVRDDLSVRQWQEQFRAGAFNAQDIYTQCRAGWYDWFCQDYSIKGLYVYCPEDAGVPLPSQQQSAEKSPKKKVPER